MALGDILKKISASAKSKTKPKKPKKPELTKGQKALQREQNRGADFLSEFNTAIDTGKIERSPEFRNEAVAAGYDPDNALDRELFIQERRMGNAERELGVARSALQNAIDKNARIIKGKYGSGAAKKYREAAERGDYTKVPLGLGGLVSTDQLRRMADYATRALTEQGAVQAELDARRSRRDAANQPAPPPPPPAPPPPPRMFIEDTGPKELGAEGAQITSTTPTMSDFLRANRERFTQGTEDIDVGKGSYTKGGLSSGEAGLDKALIQQGGYELKQESPSSPVNLATSQYGRSGKTALFRVRAPTGVTMPTPGMAGAPQSTYIPNQQQPNFLSGETPDEYKKRTGLSGVTSLFG